MRQFNKFLSGMSLMLAIPSLALAAFDGNEPVLCAIRDVHECGAGNACSEVTPESVVLPDFFAIDLSSQQITSVGTGDVTVSPIERVERLNGKLILQGGDASGDNPRGGVGWTLTLNEADGKMVMAGVGDGFAVVVFGSCVQQ
jgi:hypothetical protein